MPLQQQEQERPPFQPVYVIPLGGAAAPIEPIVVGPCNTRPLPQLPVPSLAPKIDPSTTSSPRKRQPLFPLNDREMKRRIVKQYMERRRRACISDKLSALHSLAVSLIGEKPQQQSHQRLEITDILNQCVSVLEGLSEFVKNEPELQAKMRRLKLPSAKESSGEQRRRRQSEASTSKGVMEEEMVEVEQENVTPRASAFTPVGRYRVATTSTPLAAPLLLPPPLCRQDKCLSVVRKRKRGSTDSGFNSLASPSTGPNSTSSFSSPAPSASASTSASSSTRLEETQLPKRPRKSSPSSIWRPYRD